MTRKKFVKQLMAMGRQRNEAERLAAYARRGFWTYEQYLEIEKQYRGAYRKLESVKISFVDLMAPAIKAAAQAVVHMWKAIEEHMSQTLYGKALLDWTRENVPQSNEQHPADALDAMVYGIDLANGPDFQNMQVMSRADHAALHGFNTNVVMVDELDGQGGGGHV